MRPIAADLLHVAWSVCLCLYMCWARGWAFQYSCTDRDAFLRSDSYGSKEPWIIMGSHSVCRRQGWQDCVAIFCLITLDSCFFNDRSTPLAPFPRYHRVCTVRECLWSSEVLQFRCDTWNYRPHTLSDSCINIW